MKRRVTFVKYRGKWTSIVGQKTAETIPFVHISSERKKCFTKKTFIRPYMDKSIFRHSLNPPDGSLNLSQYVPKHVSDWVTYSKVTGQNDWKFGTKHLFHVDLVKHRIFVVDTADDFIKFMKTYGISDERSHTRVLYQRDRIQSRIDSTIEWISALLESIEGHLSTKDITDEAMVEMMFQLRNGYDLLYEENEAMRNFEYEKEMYDWIDYGRMADEGYNGIYYSKKLMADRKKLCRPGQGELHSYLEWLGCDTLAIWNWCF